MPLFVKPQNINKVWSSSGDRVAPTDQKINQGWVPEIPPHQWFNFIDNKQDQAIAHINQMGIPQWDAVTEYQANKSYVQGPTDGVIYRATQTHTNQNPEVSSGYWTVAFLTQAPSYDGTYVRLDQNLADIPNKVQARTNLGVYSTTQTNTLLQNKMSPADFTGSGNQLLNSTKGYQKVPGGIIIQWGTVSVPGDSTASVAWSVAFPNAVASVTATFASNISVADDAGVAVINKTRTGAVIMSGAGGGTRNIQYIAIGW